MCFDQIYSIDEVALRNGKNGARTWTVIKNSVYDLTEFVNFHPGGSDLILEYAGKDATNAFRQIGHSMEANQMLKTYKIGDLAILEESSRSGSLVSSVIEGCSSRQASVKKQKRRRTKIFFCV